MGADATTEIEHLATEQLLLKAQGVSDVIRAAQVPSRQLQQVADSHRVFIEAGGIVMEGARMKSRQVVRAAGKTGFHLIEGEGQMGAEVVLGGQAVVKAATSTLLDESCCAGLVSRRGQPASQLELAQSCQMGAR